MRIGVSFSGFSPLASSFSLARAAEDARFDSAWYCKHLGFHDAIVPAAVMLDRHPVLAGEPLDGVHANHVFDTFRTMPAAAPPQLDIMAIRPKMLALAAEIADGVSLSTGASIEYLSETVQVIESALRAHGRPRETFRITAQALGALGDTDEDAVARVAPTFMIFSPQILSVLAPGLDPARDVAQMAIAGTVTTVAERLAQYRDAGIDEVAIDFAHDPDEAVEVIAAFGRARP